MSLEAVRLLLTPIFLERVPTQIAGTVYGVEESQFWMYASPIRQPLFKGRNDLDVNIRWALHCTNFFKNHLIDPEERTLHDAFAALPNNQVPTFWKKRLGTEFLLFLLTDCLNCILTCSSPHTSGSILLLEFSSWNCLGFLLCPVPQNNCHQQYLILTVSSRSAGQAWKYVERNICLSRPSRSRYHAPQPRWQPCLH